MSFIRNFHNARPSLIQSAIKHVIGHGGQAQAGPAAEGPIMDIAGRVLEDIREVG